MYHKSCRQTSRSLIMKESPDKRVRRKHQHKRPTPKANNCPEYNCPEWVDRDRGISDDHPHHQTSDAVDKIRTYADETCKRLVPLFKPTQRSSRQCQVAHVRKCLWFVVTEGTRDHPQRVTADSFTGDGRRRSFLHTF